MSSVNRFFQDDVSSPSHLHTRAKNQDKNSKKNWHSPTVSILGVSFTKNGATPGLAETDVYAPGIS